VIRNVMLPLSLSFCSISMYYCLTWWTGAVPAEYFSLQKRKGYSEYMKKTPMLIPRLKDVFRILFRRG
jgi:steroid 5-alpha reductase family enzyme